MLVEVVIQVDGGSLRCGSRLWRFFNLRLVCLDPLVVFIASDSGSELAKTLRVCRRHCSTDELPRTRARAATYSFDDRVGFATS